MRGIYVVRHMKQKQDLHFRISTMLGSPTAMNLAVEVAPSALCADLAKLQYSHETVRMVSRFGRTMIHRPLDGLDGGEVGTP
jgi:hypothetical protein